jgi:DNA polymerase-3 subunit alpha
VFSKTWAETRDVLVPEAIVLVKGRVEQRGEGEVKVIALEVMPFSSVPDFGTVRLQIDARTAPATVIDDLKMLIGEFPGHAPVVLELATSAGAKRLRLGPSYRVNPEGAFFAEAKAILSDAALIA